MLDLYDDRDDEGIHLSAIETLAHELNQPTASVKEAYERELARLKSGARVKDYLVVLTSRKVREGLRQR